MTQKAAQRSITVNVLMTTVQQALFVMQRVLLYCKYLVTALGFVLQVVTPVT